MAAAVYSVGVGRQAVFLNVDGTFVNDRGVVPPSVREGKVAGPIQSVLRVEVTAAVGRCDTCGHTGPMAEVRVFDHAPGVVARCPIRDQVLLRLVRGPGRPRLARRARPGLPAISRIGRDLSRLRIGCSCPL